LSQARGAGCGVSSQLRLRLMLLLLHPLLHLLQQLQQHVLLLPHQ
jgi:hypothetical protein